MGKVKKVGASGASHTPSTTEESAPLETHQWHGRHIREVAGLRELGPVIPVEQYDGLNGLCCTVISNPNTHNQTRFGRLTFNQNCGDREAVWVSDQKQRASTQVKQSACATLLEKIQEYPRATECRSLNGQNELFLTESYDTGYGGAQNGQVNAETTSNLTADATPCLCSVRAQRCRDYGKSSISTPPSTTLQLPSTSVAQPSTTPKPLSSSFITGTSSTMPSGTSFQPSTTFHLPSTSFITGTHLNMPNSTSSLHATSSHAPSTSLVPNSSMTPTSSARWITPSNTPSVNGGTIAALGSLSVSLVIASGVLALVVGVYMLYKATACIYHKVKKTGHHDVEQVKATSPSNSLRPPLPLPPLSSIYETVNIDSTRIDFSLHRSMPKTPIRHNSVKALSLELPDPPYVNHAIYQVPKGRESEYIQMNSITQTDITRPTPADDGYNTAELQAPIYDETPNYDHVPTPTHVSDSWYVNHSKTSSNGRIKMLSESSTATISETEAST